MTRGFPVKLKVIQVHAQYALRRPHIRKITIYQTMIFSLKAVTDFSLQFLYAMKLIILTLLRCQFSTVCITSSLKWFKD